MPPNRSPRGTWGRRRPRGHHCRAHGYFTRGERPLGAEKMVLYIKHDCWHMFTKCGHARSSEGCCEMCYMAWYGLQCTPHKRRLAPQVDAAAASIAAAPPRPQTLGFRAIAAASPTQSLVTSKSRAATSCAGSSRLLRRFQPASASVQDGGSVGVGGGAAKGFEAIRAACDHAGSAAGSTALSCVFPREDACGGRGVV
jgi:hypothetical protein